MEKKYFMTWLISKVCELSGAVLAAIICFPIISRLVEKIGLAESWAEHIKLGTTAVLGLICSYISFRIFVAMLIVKNTDGKQLK